MQRCTPSHTLAHMYSCKNALLLILLRVTCRESYICVKCVSESHICVKCVSESHICVKCVSESHMCFSFFFLSDMTQYAKMCQNVLVRILLHTCTLAKMLSCSYSCVTCHDSFVCVKCLLLWHMTQYAKIYSCAYSCTHVPLQKCSPAHPLVCDKAWLVNIMAWLINVCHMCSCAYSFVTLERHSSCVCVCVCVCVYSHLLCVNLVRRVLYVCRVMHVCRVIHVCVLISVSFMCVSHSCVYTYSIVIHVYILFQCSFVCV